MYKFLINFVLITGGKVENGVSREGTPDKAEEDREIDEGIGEADSDTKINSTENIKENKTNSSNKTGKDTYSKDTCSKSDADDENLPLLVNDQTDSKDEMQVDGVASCSMQDSENWDEENGIDEKNNDEEYRQYFTASMQIDTQSGERCMYNLPLINIQ